MLIFRYLAKEVFIVWASLTIILLLIFMSNQFVHYLNRATSGQIPGIIVMQLMMLEIPNLLGLLLPLGFYMSLLIAFGRMYEGSEMTVLNACGYSPAMLLKHSFIMASVVTILVMITIFWISPIIATERVKLLSAAGIQTLIQTITPSRFQGASHGRDVFYVDSMNSSHSKAQQIFLARNVTKKNSEGSDIQWDVVWADSGFSMTDKKTYEDYVILNNGNVYQGVTGQANYKVVAFKEYKARLPHPIIAIKKDLRTADLLNLLPIINQDPHKAAELQWRISVPLMVLTLTLSAVPLSRVNARTGKYSQLLPAVVLYIIYANFMFVSHGWLAAGKIPVWVGMWWLHFVVASVGFLLIWRNKVKLA